MKYAKIIAGFGLAAMSTVLIYAFSTGDFSAEGSLLLNLPWGIVSLVDLYVGFILFSSWIFYRESIWYARVFWILLIMILGFWAGSLYAFVALIQSKGDWKKFWMGKHAI